MIQIVSLYLTAEAYTKLKGSNPMLLSEHLKHKIGYIEIQCFSEHKISYIRNDIGLKLLLYLLRNQTCDAT